MKLKNIPAILAPNLFLPKAEDYGHSLVEIDLGEYGTIDYAKWDHPRWQLPGPDEALVRGLKTFLREGDVAIDIGAHQGDTTVPIALACGASGAVFGFEPNTHVFPVLKKNSALNTGKMRIIPYPYAATETDGPLTFWYSDAGFHNGGRYEGVTRWRHNHVMPLEVEGRQVVHLLEREHPELIERLRLIKTDTEGCDLDVLRTLAPLIERYKPYIRCELYQKSTPEQRHALYDFVASFGYTLNVYAEPEIFGEPANADTFQRDGTFDIIATPPAPG